MAIIVNVTTEDGELLDRLRVDWATGPTRVAPGLREEVVLSNAVTDALRASRLLDTDDAI